MTKDVLASQVSGFRDSLKKIRDHYETLDDRDSFLVVEDDARRAFRKLGDVADSFDMLSTELAQVEKWLRNLVEEERELNKKSQDSKKQEITICHELFREFTASDLFKLK